jgi:CubicO group peptidase (beta-lactamase class C family)
MSAAAFSRTRLARMHDVMARHVEHGGVPGIVTLVSRRGEVHVDAIGALAVDGGAPMRRDTIVRIASVSKPIVAAAAMILVEECRLRLDDPVDDWLPELKDRKVLRNLDGALDDTVPATRPISLRDLLTFRAGYGLVMAPPGRYPIQKAVADAGLATGPISPSVPPDEVMRRFGSLPLLQQPGERWLYHSASDILGVLVARAAGTSLGNFLRARLLEPLGMKDTGFSVPAGKLDRFATCYQRDGESGGLRVFDEARGGRFTSPPPFESGGGGLVSTADDLLAFGEMMLNKGNHGRERILVRPTVELMTTNQLTPQQRAESGIILEGRGWGFGLAVDTDRDTIAATPGRFGWDGGYGTSWRVDPKEEMIGILLTQRLWDSPRGPAVAHDFWTLAYQAIDD